jgi:hypothetical protein
VKKRTKARTVSVAARRDRRAVPKARAAAQSRPGRGPLTNRASYLADGKAVNAQPPRWIQLQLTLRMSVRLLGSVAGSTSGAGLPWKASAVEPVNPSKIADKAKLVWVVENPATDLKHHRSVPDHQVPERRRVTFSDKAI